jgi:hypothetical protein
LEAGSHGGLGQDAAPSHATASKTQGSTAEALAKRPMNAFLGGPLKPTPLLWARRTSCTPPRS